MTVSGPVMLGSYDYGLVRGSPAAARDRAEPLQLVSAF
jgi:hypothetical protein